MTDRHPLPAPLRRAMEIVREVSDREASVRFYRDGQGRAAVATRVPGAWTHGTSG